MENNVMEKATKYVDQSKQILPDSVMKNAKDFANIAGDQLGRAADLTEKQVKKYPLPAIGIAVGAGIGLGVLGTLLFRPRQQTLMNRFEDLELGSRLAKLYSKYF
ncbi:MAG: hypothetical protein JNK82_09085 [Myxococcaceae bacterium]|nr:hypothetical protein [Myxococcaceae bacterium]